MEAEPVRLHCQRAAQDAVPALAEQQPQGVREAGADHDPPRLGAYAARACQVLGERLAQFPAARRVARAERLVGRLLERPPVGGEPVRARERGGVRGALPEVVSWATRACGRLLRDPGTALEGLGAVGDAGARALAGGQPALGGEFRVGVGDRVAGDTEVGGERAVRGQAGAGGESAAAYGVPQCPDEGGAAAARAGQLQVQVSADGPRSPP
ncbi:hypothetical protein SSP24_18330 [Streptomyces spinoverrucosus]|uniref:Uncharacterized protein n=1 Tax=Streptomyces spinoverrucosus TaxID=284043 RepID=A0A4Y3VDK7_9ACTN|nr:hypothetical protein SSP24_18330 [Streptomyces spinoverrucosus]GHB46730.1 hypothetical protein GCM10010397_15800 [Streptomyces spinoverrucosus]